MLFRESMQKPLLILKIFNSIEIKTQFITHLKLNTLNYYWKKSFVAILLTTESISGITFVSASLIP